MPDPVLSMSFPTFIGEQKYVSTITDHTAETQNKTLCLEQDFNDYVWHVLVITAVTNTLYIK